MSVVPFTEQWHRPAISNNFVSDDIHIRTQCSPAPALFYLTASWPAYIPVVSYLSIWGNQDLTRVAGCWSLNLCHSFSQHPSAATPQSLLQSSGWPLEDWEEDKVDSLSVPNCWNKPLRHFQLFVSLMRKRIFPILRILPYTHTLPRGTGGGFHVNEAVLRQLDWATWLIKGCWKKDHFVITTRAKAPTMQMQIPDNFPWRAWIQLLSHFSSLLCVFSRVPTSAVTTDLGIVLSTSVSLKCLEALGQEWHWETFFRHLLSVFLVRRHFDEKFRRGVFKHPLKVHLTWASKAWTQWVSTWQ